MSTEALLEPVDNILAIYNPNSASAEAVKRHTDGLVEYGTNHGFIVNPVESVAGLLGTISLLESHVDDHTRIVTISGDGGVHDIANAHAVLGLDNGVATLGTGGARDIHRSLHQTGWHSRNPHSVLASPLVRHQPLKITAAHESLPIDDHRRKLQAVAYFSIGFTADMARRFNQPEFREKLDGKSAQHRLVIQAVEVLKSMPGYDKPFTVYDVNGVREVNEWLYPNGDRMARVNRFKGLSLLEPGYGRLQSKKITIPRSLGTAAKARGGLFRKFDPDHVERFTIETRDGDDFVVQADGETYSYPSDTRFSIELSDRVLPLATTLLRYQTELDLTTR